MKKIIGLIPARGGSKRFPGKNVHKINNKMLYEFTLESAVDVCDSVYISTDIEMIINNENRVKIIQRPEYLCQDTSTMEQVVAHAISEIPDEDFILVLLQPTSPMRTKHTIRSALDIFLDLDYPSDTLLLSGCKTQGSILKSWLFDGSDYLPINSLSYSFGNDQELPVVFKPNGALYIFSSNTFLENGFAFNLFNIFQMPYNESIDINTIEDIEIMFKGNESL